MSNRPKIAILASFPAWILFSEIPNPGTHYAVWLVSLFRIFSQEKLPFEIHWISLHKGIKQAIRETVNGQYFHILPRRSKLLSQLTLYTEDRWRINRELHSIQPDLIHAWGTEDCYGYAVRNVKIPSILSMQGVLTAYSKRAKMPDFQIRQAWYEKRTLSKFDLITTESQWAADCCREIAPDSDIRLWEYAANEDFFAVERNLSDEPSCLIAGTNSPVKNVPCAISAFSRPELRHIKLYMAGISPEEYLNLPPNIIPLGRVSRDKMRELLSSTWCLVHPSLADSCPNIVKEARVMGVPVIVTTECGAKQYVINGKSGYIIPCHNEIELAQSVLNIVVSKETSLDMGSYDKHRCLNELSATTMENRIFELYKELLNR